MTRFLWLNAIYLNTIAKISKISVNHACSANKKNKLKGGFMIEIDQSYLYEIKQTKNSIARNKTRYAKCL